MKRLFISPDYHLAYGLLSVICIMALGMGCGIPLNSLCIRAREVVNIYSDHESIEIMSRRVVETVTGRWVRETLLVSVSVGGGSHVVVVGLRNRGRAVPPTTSYNQNACYGSVLPATRR